MQTSRRLWVIFGLLLLAVGLFSAIQMASPAQAGLGPLSTRRAPNPLPTCGPQFIAQNTPNSGTTDNALTGVASLAPNDSWAVGFYTNTSGIAQSLIEHWDGSVWSIVSPNISPNDNYLQAVSARTSTDIWAVGYYRTGTGTPFQTLILHYNGTQWTQSTSPSPGSAENYLYGVAFVSATDAWAVGYYSNITNVYHTLALQWNGNSWAQVMTPNVFLAAGLRGIAVISPTDIWVVGAQADVSLTLRTYAIHWNGSTWSSNTTPGTGGCLLTSVAATAPTDLWAVGACQTTSYQTLILHYTGGSWSAVSSPSPGSGDNALGGVTVVTANEAYAVGGYSDGTSTQSLALSWDGASWSQVPSDNPGTTSDELLSATVISGTTGVVTVGLQASGGASQTLAESKVVVVCELTATPTNTVLSTATATAHTSGTATPTSPLANTPTATNTIPVATPSAISTATPVPPTQTPGSVGTATPTRTPAQPTSTAGSQGTATATPSSTSTACPIQFTDVPNGSTFYGYIRCLACRLIVNGYSDGTFRPNNNVTRGQLSKIVSNSAGFNDPQTVQMFQDVPPGSTFFDYIGRLASRGYIGGYPCGGAGEPCVPPDNLPYFRPNNNATRGQISKIVSNAAGFTDPPVGQTFEDVAPGSTFYDFIERLALRGVMSGYPCGGAGEPCIPPDNRPYFRPNNNATRGQTSKIVANTFFPGCDSPGR